MASPNSPTTDTTQQPVLSHLETIAASFLVKIKDPDRKFIQDRVYHLKTYPLCFLGSDAVTVLTEVLTDMEYPNVSRPQAMELGRAMNAELEVFQHVTNGHEIKDEKLFYKLHKILPSQVALARRNSNRKGGNTNSTWWDYTQLFEETVDVQDRVYHFKTYKHCFIGQEAVDTILNLQLAVDRPSAVQFMLECNGECNAFEHVTRDHDFADAYLFFRFIPKKERMLNPSNQTQTLAAMLLNADMVSLNGSSHDFSLPSEITNDSNHSSRIGSEYGDDDTSSAPTGARGYGRSGSGVSVSSVGASTMTSMDSSVMVRLLPPDSTLEDIAARLERDLPVKDHHYRFTVYKRCFIAKDVVTYLVKNRLASSRSRGELIGRQLEAQFNLFRHVSKAHHFRDKHYFFRFTPKEQRKEPSSSKKLQQPGSLTTTSTSAASENAPSIVFPKKPSMARLTRIVSRETVMADLQEAETSLQDIGTAFERGIRVQDRVYRMHTYKNAFTGPHAITFLVKKGFAHSRQDAVLLGRMLMEELDLFEHVGDNGKDLVDCPFSTLYQLTPSVQRKEQMAVKQQHLEEVQERDASDVLDALPDESQKEQQEKQTEADSELLEVSAVFRQGVKIKHHRYRGKIFPNTFIGSQAVDFLVNSSLVECRRDAVRVGRRIMHELQTFDHVTHDHDFSDDYKFYRFEEHRTISHGKRQASVTDRVHSALDSSLTGLGIGPKSVSSVSSTPAHSTDDITGGEDFLPLEKIAHGFRMNVNVKDRRYRFSTYRDAFIGSEAVDYLVGKTSWASSRQSAVQLGQTLMRELDLFHHVTKGHTFRDDEFFYSFTDKDEESLLKRLESTSQDAAQPFLDNTGAMTPSLLIEVARALEEGLKPQDHKFHLRMYKNTLTGTEIISFLVDKELASTRAEALQLGRAACKHFMLFYHVTMDHLLKDSNMFYTVVPPAKRTKGQWFKSTYGNRLRDKMIKAATNRKNLSTSEYWDLVVDVIENNNFDFRASSLEVSCKDFMIDSSDLEWTKRVRTFELRVSRWSATRNLRFSTFSIPEVRTAISRARQWSNGFIRLDPRQQIHRFYNEVAQTGANHQFEGGTSESVRAITIDALRPLFRFLPINLASVFTVWRPTSYAAIRKMMMGEAVGKGLDIKGKSSRRGKLSGYVPFLQISENKHKGKVRRLSPHHMVRVFYKPGARRARDSACAELERVLMDMMEMVEEAKNILASDKPDKSMHKNALECMLLDVTNPSITPIDDFAPSCYGIEMPERLFWEAYFVRQDCTRKEGSIYDSGRPSQPAFQDMNFAALRGTLPSGTGGGSGTPQDSAPTVVIYQNADRDDPMNPFELLMAYEEQGRVLPVVSDFDCFLLGTRRVRYTEPLPPNQLEVLRWCVKHIEQICETMLAERDNGKRQKRPWSLMWLEVLKDSSFHPEIPPYGFGDPTSYSIVENAVERLSVSGAVRHGAECFNYYWPQDLDEEFLFVSEKIGDNNVPWKYVGIEELQSELAAKIEEGFCFPLNPKWILMDPGWMQLYQKQLKSKHSNIQHCMSIWFPPDSGLREDIERIYKLQKKLRKLERQSDFVMELTESKHNEIEMMYFT